MSIIGKIFTADIMTEIGQDRYTHPLGLGLIRYERTTMLKTLLRTGRCTVHVYMQPQGQHEDTSSVPHEAIDFILLVSISSFPGDALRVYSSSVDLKDSRSLA